MFICNINFIVTIISYVWHTCYMLMSHIEQGISSSYVGSIILLTYTDHMHVQQTWKKNVVKFNI